MFFTTKIKRFIDNKNTAETYVVQCDTYTEAELLIAKIFRDDSNYRGIDSVTKYNLKRTFLDVSYDAYYQAKIEFAFPDVKAAKEFYLVQARDIDNALAYMNTTIHENEKGFASILEMKKMDFSEVYDEEMLKEMGVYTDKNLKESVEDLIDAIGDMSFSVKVSE